MFENPIEPSEPTLEIVSYNGTTVYSDSIRRAAEALRDGQLVAFPTETVYGIAASATNPDAMQRLRRLKQLQDDRPFTVHLSDRADAARFVTQSHPVARRLSRRAWPGPLTIVCEVPDPGSTEIGRPLSPQQRRELYFDGSIGLRLPAHPAALDLIRLAGVPVVGTSANRTGAPPPTDFSQVSQALSSELAFGIDAGRTRFDVASTVVQVKADGWTVLREGVLDERTLRRMARHETVMVCTGNSCRSPMAEYLYRRHLARRWDTTEAGLAGLGFRVSSAGVAAVEGGPVSRGALEELRVRGIDASAHESHLASVERLQRADRIYAMTPEHADRILELSPAGGVRVELLDPNGPIADPMGGGPDAYRACARQIEQAVLVRLEELLDEDRHW